VALRDDIELRIEAAGAGATCRRILGTLPSWFGIPASVEDYVAVADRSLTVVASREDQDVGFLTLLPHGPSAAEIYVMGVIPEEHRQGIGRMLLAEAEARLATAGVEFLQVKTLSSRKSDEGYDKTRAFYLSRGFRLLEELPAIWGPDNPAVQMIKAIQPIRPT
jgi:ribosomal protein S18 acetylase RimI-like enzyme